MSPTPQFSGLATLPLYRQLCPLVSGLGVAVHATLLARAVLNIAVVVWAARAAYDIFALLDTEAGVATVREVARLQHEAPTSEVQTLHKIQLQQHKRHGCILSIILCHQK